MTVASRETLTSFGYIAGTSNCGSTLLSFLLNAQPGLASVGEVAWSVPEEHPGRFPCSCGASLDDCPFWRQVSREMKKKGYLFNPDHWKMAFQVSESRIVQRLAVRPLASNLVDRVRDRIVKKIPSWGKSLTQIGERNLALSESIATLRDAVAFVDASKDPARVRLLREYSAIEPHVIHLVRDSPAFVKSFTKKDRGRFQVAIRWWNRTMWQMEQLKKTTPAHLWLQVRYEDLCADPKNELKRIMQFLGANEASPNLHFRSAPHHIIGNKMRLGVSSEIRLDTSWREGLSKTQLAEILMRTSKYRQIAGYADTV